MNQPLSQTSVQILKQVFLAEYHRSDDYTAEQIDADPVTPTSIVTKLYTAILDLPEMRAKELKAYEDGKAFAEAVGLNEIARLREALEMIELIPSMLGAERLTVWSARVQDPTRFMELRKQALSPVVAGGEQKTDSKFQEFLKDKHRAPAAANQQVDNAVGGFEERRAHQRRYGDGMGWLYRNDGTENPRVRLEDRRKSAQSHSQTKEAE